MRIHIGSILSFVCLLLRGAIFLNCLAIVSYYVIYFMKQYIEYPQVVSMGYDFTIDQPAFPEIIICTRNYSEAYNETILRECGLPET